MYKMRSVPPQGIPEAGTSPVCRPDSETNSAESVALTERSVNTPPWTHHTHVFTLASGERVFHNVVSGYAVEKDHQYLVQPTEAEQDEIDEIIEDAAFAEQCQLEQRATYQQSVLPDLPTLKPIESYPNVAVLHRIMSEYFGMGDDS